MGQRKKRLRDSQNNKKITIDSSKHKKIGQKKQKNTKKFYVLTYEKTNNLKKIIDFL